jgi:phosphoglycolate phosphatase
LIAHILAVENIDAQAAVMVGDRHYDMVGAQQNGVSAIGVTWGFGTEQELVEAGAIGLCKKPQALANQAKLLLPLPPAPTTSVLP